MLNVRSSLVVVGCVFVGFVASAGPGLVARAAEPPRWIEDAMAAGDGSVVLNDDDAQRRVGELEQRVRELEAERRAATQPAHASGDAPRELVAAVARNQELMARIRALSLENQELVQSQLFEHPAGACEPPPGEADPKAQLRYWADRIRTGESGFRSRLTAEQNAALNVLLRRERELDAQIAWHEQ